MDERESDQPRRKRAQMDKRHKVQDTHTAVCRRVYPGVVYPRHVVCVSVSRLVPGRLPNVDADATSKKGVAPRSAKPICHSEAGTRNISCTDSWGVERKSQPRWLMMRSLAA